MNTVIRRYNGHTCAIEQPVASLVDALQNLSVHTFSSCAGHENPSECQAPAGEWYVSFSLDRNHYGWMLFDWLTFVASAFPDVEFVSWWNGPDDEIVEGGSDFEIRGNGETSADEVASWLSE